PDVVDDGTYDPEEITRRENLCMKAVMLDEEQIEKYSGIMQKLPDDKAGDTSYETYVKDCQARRERAAYEFEPDDKGFSSKINAPKDELVFYSVPWSEGFTAYVDGNETEIEKVFGGLCAVFVPKGDHTVRFDYSTPGLKIGIKVSVGAAAVLAVYTVCCIVFGVRRRKGKK
ncbi:YfhO family protein, partial [uncultured Ruminococcus sp.]|uniref:YfhO family protein n=1 Tax=uncultured Ruminococcus sp. TaxID=165186 RepID=UPI0025DAB4DA